MKFLGSGRKQGGHLLGGNGNGTVRNLWRRKNELTSETRIVA